MDDQLFYLAIQSRSSQDMLDVATYFEVEGERQRAVTLYQKGGWLEKARELSGDSGVSVSEELIGEVAQKIATSTGAAEMQSATKRLIDMGLTDQAVEILALNGQAEVAMDLCAQYNVELSETLANKMLKGVYGEARTRLLTKIADFCLKQKSFYLAAKKYTESGDNQSAMNALILSQDTDKVILFAQALEDAEVYIQAAGYLQTLNWRTQPAIMRHIIEYYSAAGDLELLGNFYENCAVSEIIEYKNYETALSALSEAYKVLKEAPVGTAVSSKIDGLRQKIKNVQQFLRIKKIYADGELREALEKAQQMIHGNNAIVRKGDIYAFIVEHYVDVGQMRTAFRKLEEMEADCGGSANVYLEEQTLVKIFASTEGGISALNGIPQADKEKVVKRNDSVKHIDQQEIWTAQ
ncbi:intraflagellar transport protein-like [Tropilaelaps mercedesae]|uniref:Intraflagellar transport protein-like n=1 Tax=Tropilaelaps mercedesae TaxID=418985 RepID=A0A1V9XZ28_9ACAR|nr:intraflagellar transport protein-like [Tropilaelaps mercedesae]